MSFLEVNENYQVTPSQNSCDKESAAGVVHSSNTSCLGEQNLDEGQHLHPFPNPKTVRKQIHPSHTINHPPQKAHQFTDQTC